MKSERVRLFSYWQLVKNVSDLELHGSDVTYRREHLLKWLVGK